jgi:hypothetical protein
MVSDSWSNGTIFSAAGDLIRSQSLRHNQSEHEMSKKEGNNQDAQFLISGHLRETFKES